MLKCCEWMEYAIQTGAIVHATDAAVTAIVHSGELLSVTYCPWCSARLGTPDRSGAMTIKFMVWPATEHGSDRAWSYVDAKSPQGAASAWARLNEVAGTEVHVYVRADGSPRVHRFVVCGYSVPHYVAKAAETEEERRTR